MEVLKAYSTQSEGAIVYISEYSTAAVEAE